HRYHRELQARASLEEQDLVVGRNPGERPHVRFAALDDVVEGLRAVADLEDRHADARQLQKVALRFLEDLDGKNGRTGGEIMNACRCSHVHDSLQFTVDGSQFHEVKIENVGVLFLDLLAK